MPMLTTPAMIHIAIDLLATSSGEQELFVAVPASGCLLMRKAHSVHGGALCACKRVPGWMDLGFGQVLDRLSGIEALAQRLHSRPREQGRVWHLIETEPAHDAEGEGHDALRVDFTELSVGHGRSRNHGRAILHVHPPELSCNILAYFTNLWYNIGL